MSIISSICAEEDLHIVKQGITRARKQINKQRLYTYEQVTKILDDLQTYCEERISE